MCNDILKNRDEKMKKWKNKKNEKMKNWKNNEVRLTMTFGRMGEGEKGWC